MKLEHWYFRSFLFHDFLLRSWFDNRLRCRLRFRLDNLFFLLFLFRPFQEILKVFWHACEKRFFLWCDLLYFFHLLFFFFFFLFNKLSQSKSGWLLTLLLIHGLFQVLEASLLHNRCNLRLGVCRLQGSKLDFRRFLFQRGQLALTLELLEPDKLIVFSPFDILFKTLMNQWV